MSYVILRILANFNQKSLRGFNVLKFLSFYSMVPLISSILNWNTNQIKALIYPASMIQQFQISKMIEIQRFAFISKVTSFSVTPECMFDYRIGKSYNYIIHKKSGHCHENSYIGCNETAVSTKRIYGEKNLRSFYNNRITIIWSRSNTKTRT